MDVVYRVDQDAVGTDSSHWMMDIGLDGQCHYIVRESTKKCIYIKQTIVTQALCIRACVTTIYILTILSFVFHQKTEFLNR